MSHKQRYKHHGITPSKLRERRRVQGAELRKSKREQLLNAKRVWVEETEEEAEEIHHDQITKAASHLVEKSADRQLALTLLCKAFGQDHDTVDTFLKVEGAMTALIGLLTGTDPDLCLGAASCLTNMAAGSHEHAKTVLKAAGAYLITYLQNSSEALQDKCAWSLGNLAGDSAEVRDSIMDLGALKPLILLLKSPNCHVVRSAAFALCNLLRHEHAHVKEVLDEGLLQILVPLMVMNEKNREVLIEVTWVLTYIAAKAEHETDLLQANVLSKLGEIVVETTKKDHEDYQMLTPALRSLGNLCSGTGEARKLLCQQCPQLLASIKILLTSQHPHIIKESLWVLSNIAAEKEVCEDLAQLDMLPAIVQKLSAFLGIQLEAAYLVCNIGSQSDELCQKLVEAGAIPLMVNILKSNELQVIPLALSFIELCFAHTQNGQQEFEEAGGMEGLELLEYHQNENIRSTTNHILDTYIYKEDPQVVYGSSPQETPMTP